MVIECIDHLPTILICPTGSRVETVDSLWHPPRSKAALRLKSLICSNITGTQPVSTGSTLAWHTGVYKLLTCVHVCIQFCGLWWPSLSSAPCPAACSCQYTQRRFSAPLCPSRWWILDTRTSSRAFSARRTFPLWPGSRQITQLHFCVQSHIWRPKIHCENFPAASSVTSLAERRDTCLHLQLR